MRAIATITLALASALPAAAQPVTYSVLDLGPGSANAINNFGQTAGTSNNMAIRWEPNGYATSLGTLGGSSSSGSAINASGQVVGSSLTSGNAATHAFVTDTSPFPTMTDLGTFGGDSFANAINDAGQVVGYVNFAANSNHLAFRTTPGGVIDAASDLGTLGGTLSNASAINASGQVTGLADVAGDSVRPAFRTTATGTISTADNLGTLGGSVSRGYAINTSGQVAGFAFVAGDSTRHAFRSSPNGQTIGLQDLGTLGGPYSEAHGINALGVVVGYASTDPANMNFVGFVFDTSMHNLNDLVPAGWDITNAGGINDAGQIAATGSFQGGPGQALLLTPMPVPEPSALALTGLVGVWLARRRWRQGMQSWRRTIATREATTESVAT